MQLLQVELILAEPPHPRLLAQVLQERLQALLERLGSEVKEEGAACEARAAVSELQRQMREFEQSICNHQRTLEMTHKLQRATEEVLTHLSQAPQPPADVNPLALFLSSVSLLERGGQRRHRPRGQGLLRAWQHRRRLSSLPAVPDV